MHLRQAQIFATNRALFGRQIVRVRRNCCHSWP